MKPVHWKHLGVGVFTVAAIFTSLWAFNNNIVHPWLALIVCGLIIVFAINYIINQLKN